MYRLLRQLLLTLILSTIIAGPIYAARPHDQSPTSSASIQLTLTSAQPQLRESTRPEGTFTTFEGLTSPLGEAGTPALPAVTELVGVPAGAPTLAVTLAAAQPLPTPAYPLEPVPFYEQSAEPASGSVVSTELEAYYVPDATIYGQKEWYPANPVSVSEPMTLRGQTLVRVTFVPVQVNLATGELRWYPAADVTLSWSEETLAGRQFVPEAEAQDPHFESVLGSSLSNYEQARAWRERPDTLPEAPSLEGVAPGGMEGIDYAAQRPYPFVGGVTWLISLEGTGLFRIPLAELQAAGVDISNPDRLAVFFGSGDDPEEQAIWIDGGYLYFINTRPHGRWSEKLIYRLVVLPGGNGT
ncbi:MAG: C25 family peptidase propeptide domain-containing protein, partial [Ardenticatenaceae bacterium]